MSKLYGVHTSKAWYPETFSGWLCTKDNFEEVVKKILDEYPEYIEFGDLIKVQMSPTTRRYSDPEDEATLSISYCDLYGGISSTDWLMMEMKTL